MGSCVGLLLLEASKLRCRGCLLQEKPLNFAMILDVCLVQESEEPKEDAAAVGVVSPAGACPHPHQVSQQIHNHLSEMSQPPLPCSTFRV